MAASCLRLTPFFHIQGGRAVWTICKVSAKNYRHQNVATGEKVTHTGQVYDNKDYRRVRFVGRQKENSSGSTGFPMLPCQCASEGPPLWSER
ncbi:NADH dehydrogenase [ubiquinone] iron-sulfur protein 6, mitochondrial [Latimeria chalumnae]|uniref:NADH dehydrogenase [ubiquinone] iron-sulfur protein 6, mitochondrial n=1 Tax=Latimeria chalumnae TaxID=7897 RepID=UPI00313AC84D